VFSSVLDQRFRSIISDFTLRSKKSECDDPTPLDLLFVIHKAAFQLDDLFPGVLKKESLITVFPANLKNKFLLKLHKIQYQVNAQKCLEVNSYIYNPVFLRIRLLRYRNQIGDTFIPSLNNISKWPVPSDKKWLVEKLGNNDSYGRLLDFADQLYDEYKQIGINPFVFRNIFFCFLSEISIIGNVAFDNYMETRNSAQSWEDSLVNYLLVNFNLSKEDSSKVVHSLFSLE